MIFSRRRGSAGRHNASDDRAGRHARSGEESGAAARDRGGADEGRLDQGGSPSGPYDAMQAPNDKLDRLDLGALRIPTLAGVEIQLQAGPQGDVQQVQLAHGGSRLQIAAFAAPRTEGIWDEIRETLRSSLAAGGARPEEVAGEYGPELRARMRDGSSTTDVRHVGIDGPRWFVHGVFLGSAAADPDRAGPLRDVLRGLVVDRGIEARPIREPLPLRLPPEAAAQLAEAAAQTPDRQAT